MQVASEASTTQALARAPHLVLPAQPTHYRVVSNWENYVNGAYQRSTIEKNLSLWVQQNEAGYAFEFQTTATRLATLRDPEPLEEMALRLAALYNRVVVQADPAGQLVALLNQEEIGATWEQLAAEIRASTLATDALTHTVLTFLGRQVQSSSRFLQSLRHDYLYQTLVLGCCGPPLPAAPARQRVFAQFFEGVPLCFAEHTSLLPTLEGALPTMQLHGPLDEQKTDLPALKVLLEAALRQEQPARAAQQLPQQLPAPHFHYQATYLPAAATSLPMQAEVQVYARVGEFFNKEYNLTLTQL